GSSLLFDHALNNILTGNLLPADVVIKTVGDSTFASNTIVKGPANFSVLVDAYSSLTFTDAGGTVLDIGSGGVATNIVPTGSFVVLNSANIGLGTVAVSSRNLHASLTGGSALVTPTVWAAAGQRA